MYWTDRLAIAASVANTQRYDRPKIRLHVNQSENGPS